MLALTRRVGERIVIGENIVITVADIKGDNIRLAIDAPKEIKIFRGEIFDAIVDENKQAVISSRHSLLDVLKDIQPKRK
jgi:carbon storage regulator